MQSELSTGASAGFDPLVRRALLTVFPGGGLGPGQILKQLLPPVPN